MTSNFAFPLFLSMLLVIGTPKAMGQDAPGTDTGKKIGTIVRTAIDTALPGVTSIVELIWSKKPTERDKIKKDELNDAVDKAKKELQSKVTIEAQKKIEPIKLVSDEVLLVNKFLDPSIQASLNVVRMQTRITVDYAVTDAIWDEEKSDWSVIKLQLKSVSDIKDEELQKVRDFWLRNKLRQIRESNKELVSRIDDGISHKDAPELRNRLTQLSLILQDMSAVVGYELDDLQVDMKDLADWAKGHMGGNSGLTDRQVNYKSMLDKRYPN